VQALLVRRLALMAGYSLRLERSPESLAIIFSRAA
jgi:hypothetical protein